MGRHVCYLSMGSNECREQNLEWARQKLTDLFPDICFSPLEETEPVGKGYVNRFLNQTARFTSVKTADEIRLSLKELERKAGRQFVEKAAGIVRLDLDLLLYDEMVCKPEDLMRDYVQRGLACLQ